MVLMFESVVSPRRLIETFNFYEVPNFGRGREGPGVVILAVLVLGSYIASLIA